jgi:hypothetical protein
VTRLGATLWKAERQFYESRDHLPAWIDGDKASPRLGALLDALKHSEDHGLDPARYGLDRFQQAVTQAEENKHRYENRKIPEIDARLTYAYLEYAADLLGWSGNPKAVYTNWFARTTRPILRSSSRSRVFESGPRDARGAGAHAIRSTRVCRPRSHASVRVPPAMSIRFA